MKASLAIVLALLLGLGLGYALLPAQEIEVEVVKYVDKPVIEYINQTVVEEVEVERIVSDPAFADQLEELEVYRAGEAYFLSEWTEEIMLNNGTEDYDDYTEDGSEVELDDYPDSGDYSEVEDKVSIEETDHEDSEWLVEFMATFEDDDYNDLCYNVSVTVEELVADDLEMLATTC